jgi:hypothetical protein
MGSAAYFNRGDPKVWFPDREVVKRSDELRPAGRQ